LTVRCGSVSFSGADDRCSVELVGAPDTVRCTPDSPVHTGQSGAPCRPLAWAMRRPRIARPTVALAAVAPPDSPVNYSRTPPIFSESGLFTGSWPGAPDSPVCQTELSLGYNEPSLFGSFLLFFSLFLALR
jgi:hypothetical protein